MEIKESFVSKKDKKANIDSLIIYIDKKHNYVVATAKQTHQLYVYDAIKGAILKKIGSKGVKKLQFHRPNGIGLYKKICFVVERDNQRIQILKLPDFKFVGFITHASIKKPYGISIQKISTNYIKLFITDNTTLFSKKRIHIFHLRFYKNTITYHYDPLFFVSSHVKKNDLPRKMESIFVDPAYDRVYVADEFSHKIRVYQLSTAKLLFHKIKLHAEPEGIGMYALNEKEGYLIFTAQSMSPKKNIFYVYDRRTLTYISKFSGQQTSNTDGIVVTNIGYGPFKRGVFVAVHNDQAISLFNWEDITQKTTLCGGEYSSLERRSIKNSYFLKLNVITRYEKKVFDHTFQNIDFFYFDGSVQTYDNFKKCLEYKYKQKEIKKIVGVKNDKDVQQLKNGDCITIVLI
jgi:3-phytase